MEEQNPAHEEAVPQPTPPRAGGDGRPPKSPSSTNPKEPGLDQLNSFFGNGSNNVGPRMEQPGLRNRRGSHGTRKLRHRRQVSRLQEFTNPLATTDTALLLASLDKENEAVEDEAEATLLDVLERRQAGIDNRDLANPTPHNRHRHRTPSVHMQSIDMLAGLQSFRRSWSQSSNETAHPLARPSIQRNASQRSSERNLVRGELDPEPSSQSTSSGLPSWRDRAREVAFKMKKTTTNNTAEGDLKLSHDGALPNLMHIIEAQRDYSVSAGSRHKGAGSGSRSKESADNASRHGNLSKGSNHSGSGNRPLFSGLYSTPFAKDGFVSGTEKWFQAVERVQEQLDQIPEEEGDELSVENANANFLSQLQSSHPEYTEYPEISPHGEQTPMLPKEARPMKPKKKYWSFQTPNPNSRFYKFLSWWSELRKQAKILAIAFDVPYVKERFLYFFQVQCLLYIVPALALSAFFYYRLSNPILSILPTDASASWWVLFLVRHYITLQLAYSAEYFFVDVLATRSLLSVGLLGPLATLYIINAKGWPFIVTIWGVLNFLLIQDSSNRDNVFFDNWLFFSNIEMFTAENPSGTVVESHTYSSVLLSMIISGVAASIKRTVTALYLGKRLYIHYKPKLEKVMESMILLNEVADLGSAIDDLEFEKADPSKREPAFQNDLEVTSLKTHDDIRHSAMKQVLEKTESGDGKQAPVASDSEDESSEDEGSKTTMGPGAWNRLRSGNRSFDNIAECSKGNAKGNTDSAVNQVLIEAPSLARDKRPSYEAKLAKSEVEDETDEDKGSRRIFEWVGSHSGTISSTGEVNNPVDELQEVQNATDAEFHGIASWPTVAEEEFLTEEPQVVQPPIETVHDPLASVLNHTSTTSHIMGLLDSWEEPTNKQDKKADPTIQEILMFRKALLFLEDTHPFGSSFGPAFTRETCIESSKSLYKRLLALSPETSVLHFDVLGVLAYNIDETFDYKKAKRLVRLFRPDKFDEVSLLHFVQSCDSVYRKLRYLRASQGNATQIDGVLESIFNSIFGFFLGLAIMAILNLKPWAFLVSMSTVLVSFAFAFGPSVAKMIEGMMMIAVRRPFDLGDRISIVADSAGASNNIPSHETWIVEDCNLFTTTLRLDQTNEVSTVTNGSIANQRIVNHARSVKALVNLTLPMRIDATNDQVSMVQSAIEQYIQDNRSWASLVSFRIKEVDSGNSLLVYSAKIQHVKSWQDLSPIQDATGELEKFCMEILFKLGIHFESYTTTNNVFIKEMPGNKQILSQETTSKAGAIFSH